MFSLISIYTVLSFASINYSIKIILKNIVLHIYEYIHMIKS